MNTQTHNTRNFIRIALATALFGALTAGASAEDVAQQHVKYADLNVNTTAGATTLYRRIRSAAEQVCGVDSDRDLAKISRTKACTAHAIAEAVAAVNSPTLTNVYDAKTGVTPGTRLAAAR